MKTGSHFRAAPDRAIRIGRAARFALAGIRVINGGIALIAPGVIIRRFGEESAADNAAVYGLRMVGVRTVALVIDLVCRLLLLKKTRSALSALRFRMKAHDSRHTEYQGALRICPTLLKLT